MNGWPVPSPPGDTSWDRGWPVWFDGWVRRRERAMVAQARKRLLARGSGWISPEHLAEAAPLAIADVGNYVNRKGANWFQDAFIAELPFLAFIAEAIAREYVRQSRAEQVYRSRITPVSPLPLAGDEKGTATNRALAELEDGEAQRALEGAEAHVDYLERQAKPVRTALRGWWSGKTPEEIAAELGDRGSRPSADEVFVAILRRYRADTAEIVEAAIAASADPCDPCQDREAACAYIQTWILATKKFRTVPRGRGYGADELALLVAARAATPLGEDPETFPQIATRLNRTSAAVERQYQRLCKDERHAWIKHISFNRHPGDPTDPRRDGLKG